MASTAQIAGLMGRESTLLGALAQLLARESAALKARDAAAVEAIAAEKHTLIRGLEALAGERGALLRAGGHAADARGYEALLAGVPGGEGRALQQQWATIKQTLTECHQQNQVNGLLLDASLRSTHQALSLLLGQGREPDTYNAQGAVRASLGTRTVAKA
jgi:flagellar biosynthesis/type III secretory pathway chaperone